MTPLSQILVTLFGWLVRAPGDAVQIHARSPHGIGRLEPYVRREGLSARYVPVVVLDLLERGWAAHVTLAARHVDAVGRPTRVGALAVAFTCPRVYQNPRDTDRPHGREWIIPPAPIDAAVTTLDAFACPASAVLVGGETVAGVWALTEAVSADDPAPLALMRRLSTALGATPLPDDVGLADLRIPVPGTLVALPPYADVVTVPVFDPARRYALADLEAALCPPSTAAPPPPKRRRAALQETA